MGLVACEAAYTHGGEWYEAVLKYIKANIDYTREYVDNNIPGVHMSEHEGTYLVWLDFRDLGLSPAEQEHLIVDEAGLWLDGGSISERQASTLNASMLHARALHLKRHWNA